MEDPRTPHVHHLASAFGTAPAHQAGIGGWLLLGWPSTDSTNTRALQALRNAPPQSLHKLAVQVGHQTLGRGQQHRPWTQQPDQDLALSVILARNLPERHPFALNMAVSLATLEGIGDAFPGFREEELEIKWPNDIMLRGMKAGGVLIENSWRGNRWSSSVVGIGINVGGQPPFPHATRLIGNSAPTVHTEVAELRDAILLRMEARLSEVGHPDALLRAFHERLHGWGRAQRWQLDGLEIRGVLESIDIEGRLCVSQEGRQHCFAPGEVGWLGLEPPAMDR